MTEKVYKWEWDCGWGSLEGVFVATPEQIKSIVGQEADFGEVLGKHSEVTGTLEADEFEVISEVSSVIEFIREHPFGYNPLDYAGPPCDVCCEKITLDKPSFWCHDCEERLCRYCSEEERHTECRAIVAYEKRGEVPA
jgi:hypothetical protein